MMNETNHELNPGAAIVLLQKQYGSYTSLYHQCVILKLFFKEGKSLRATEIIKLCSGIMAPSTVTRHLRILKTKGVIKIDVFPGTYVLNRDPCRSTIQTLKELFEKLLGQELFDIMVTYDRHSSFPFK